MSNSNLPTVNIALVGGTGICTEVLAKTAIGVYPRGTDAPIVAVVDPDPQAPGMTLARELGLSTFSDYRELYDPELRIGLIVLLKEDKMLFNAILTSRPETIRLMSKEIFEIFWRAITHEENKLREEKKAMETIVNGIEDFILVIKPDMEIVDANVSFLRKMGVSRKEVIGRKCIDIFHCSEHLNSRHDPFCPLREVIRNKCPAHKLHSHINRQGEDRFFEVSIYPIWEKDGAISRFVHISRDVTLRKREEEEITNRLEQMVEERTRQLQETHDKLLHQNKMASLGKLAASVVHEINNPIAGSLNLIMLIKRIISEGPPSDADLDQFNRYLTLMETETRRISRIVSNLLAFSRQSKLELQKLDINPLLEKTLLLYSNMLKLFGIQIVTQLEKDIPPMVGSQDQLQQVIMNLISNAAEAMENAGDGTLTLQTRYQADRKCVELLVQDTGCGIPKEHCSKLFEPFFTTKKRGKGVGLGLSVVYGIIQEHRGTIRVTSQVEEGTTFSVWLPLDPKTSSLVQGESGAEDENSDR